MLITIRLVNLNNYLNIVYWLRLVGINNYFYDVFSIGKWGHPGNFFKVSICNF